MFTSGFRWTDSATPTQVGIAGQTATSTHISCLVNLSSTSRRILEAARCKSPLQQRPLCHQRFPKTDNKVILEVLLFYLPVTVKCVPPIASLYNDRIVVVAISLAAADASTEEDFGNT